MNQILINVILVIHILIALALTGVVMLQRSEGGALGIGGGGAGGGVFSGRGVANALVRTTMILAAGFFITSLALTTIANRSKPPVSAVVSETGEPGVELDDGASAPTLPRLDPGAPLTSEPVAPSVEPVLDEPVQDGPVLDEPATDPAPEGDTPPVGETPASPPQ